MIQTLGVKLWILIVNFRRAKVSPEKHAQKREWVNCFFASIDNFSQAGCYVVAVRDKMFYRGGVGNFFFRNSSFVMLSRLFFMICLFDFFLASTKRKQKNQSGTKNCTKMRKLN